MTQEDVTGRFNTPDSAVRGTVAKLRKRQGWTAEDLAKECAQLGMPALNRSVIANIESGRRKYVTVDELCCLAYALDVAPVHLLVPTDDDPGELDLYAAAPDRFLPVRDAREWIRGAMVPPGRDPRQYFANVPADEFEAIRASDTRENIRGLWHMLEGKPPKRSEGDA